MNFENPVLWMKYNDFSFQSLRIYIKFRHISSTFSTNRCWVSWAVIFQQFKAKIIKRAFQCSRAFLLNPTIKFELSFGDSKGKSITEQFKLKLPRVQWKVTTSRNLWEKSGHSNLISTNLVSSKVFFSISGLRNVIEVLFIAVAESMYYWDL